MSSYWQTNGGYTLRLAWIVCVRFLSHVQWFIFPYFWSCSNSASVDSDSLVIVEGDSYSSVMAGWLVCVCMIAVRDPWSVSRESTQGAKAWFFVSQYTSVGTKDSYSYWKWTVRIFAQLCWTLAILAVFL